MEHSNTTPAKISILDTGKFKQWKFRIQQYLQNERYALWEVIEFGDSYEVPKESAATGSASDEKKGRTVAITTEDMQKRKNDVKARTTLLLALPNEHQLRFSKYKMAQELWVAILKTFGGNEATRKTKKNLLKQQYGNFKAEGKETLEQIFNRLQAIVSQLEFMDVEIKQDDLNQKLLTSLAPEWLMHTIVWRNRSDLDTMSLDDLYNHLKNSSGNEEDNTASVLTASTQVSHAGATIDEDDIEEMDIKWNMALLSMRADRFWKKTGKRFLFKGQMWLALISQRVGWDWSYMANDEENHALVVDEEEHIEFALMAKTSTDNEVFDNSLCSKACKKNTDSLNSQIIELSEKLGDTKNMLYHYKLGLSHVEGRLVEFKNQEIKFCEKIRGLEFSVECKTNRIENLTNELETLKKEKEGLESKLTGFKSASKNLDNLIETHRSDKNKEGLGYSDVPPPHAQVYSSLKKDMSWTGLPEFADDTITDYTRPSPNSPTVVKTDKKEIVRNPTVKYAELYRKTPKRKFPTGNSRFSTVDVGNKGKAINIDDKGYWDSGCSRHMTGNISYLSDYEPYNRGYVSFGQECIVLGRNFKLSDDANVLLRTPRQHNMYSIDLNNVVLHKDLTYLVAKASTEECMLWHMRLGHLNIKAMNRLVSHNLVRGLPSKCFENDHTCVACLKGKHHKASCKTKLVNSVTKPIHTLHIDLFGPTSVSSLNHKWYCLVVTDDFSRVFNKRNKRVEENLHVDFLENKPIEKGAGPNWLFDIDSLTNSMNYVPVVVAGTNSTNFSGTKDVASQDVKKDVSSLRYIVLPNWFHEAHLETSTSNAQDAYNANAPDSSGNSNPTATLTNPPADHMETLAVETPIPTASSSVLTACLNDSPKLSSDTRLISKRVTSQDDTPSLDNILTLTNRFEDILGVTTNTDDTNGVEADLGNMEDNISASPTSTLRIHKDHPKSQIIGHVDTSVLKNKKDERGIVIRNKARLVAQGHTHEEMIDYDEVFTHVARIEAIRLFLAYASFMGFTVYQMDVKSAFLYGSDVMQPPGFQDLEFPARVYKVEKAMYGLHQAPRAWYGTLSKYLLTNGFQKDVRSSNTPMDKENPWGKDGTRKDVDLHLYRSMIRSLMYLTASRPDIMFAVCACARHQVIHKECHLHAAKRIFRYLKGHPKLKLWYPKESSFDLTIVVTLTTKTEYVAAASACEQVLWIQNQLLDYRLSMPCEALSKEISSSILLLIETTEEGTEILATVDGKLRTVSESSIKRNLKLNDEAGISSLPDAELFENLTLIGYNISPNQKFTFQKGQFSHQWKYLIHTIMQCLSPKSTGFNEFSSNISIALVCLATNRVYNFSKMIFDGMVKNVNNKVSKFLMYPRFLSKCLKIGTSTEPHHTPTYEETPSLQHELTSSSLPLAITEPLPNVIPSDNPPLRQYTRRTRIAQSFVLPTVADEPASPIGDFSQGKACPTDSGLKADQDRANITKASTLPSDSTPKVTSLATDKGSMQHKLTKLMDLCTRQQRKQAEMASKINAQELEISQLKARVRLLEDKEGGGIAQSGEDAPIKGRSLDEEEATAAEKSTERGSDDTEEMVNVLTSLDAAKILTSGGVQVSISPAKEFATATVSIPTGSGSILTTSLFGTGVPTGSGMVPTASLIFTTARESTPYIRRKGKEKMVESDTPKKKNLQEQIDVQVVRELEEEMARDAHRMNEQIVRDAEIARIHVEEELQMMIDGLDRNIKTVAKYLLSKENLSQGSNKESEIFKRKGLRLVQDSAKKLKTSEEVLEEKLKEMMELIPVEEVYVEALQVKHLIIDWEVHTKGERSYWKIIRLRGSITSYQFFVDLLKHFDREDLNQLWALVKETLNIRPVANDKENEL
uniref:Ribonuclease H-like domain-containing protein n=1 Tax=Tanacetum cinerariifolium TaxID=118510 RepID=A0A6L2KFM5_TANCI|nr:ribonuclease H-like domain-containing protein [Tanacetum cinerariifolium]